jgi:hypothetical protein
VLALQEINIEVEVMPEATRFVGTLGGVVSGKGKVVTFRGANRAELFPA